MKWLMLGLFASGSVLGAPRLSGQSTVIGSSLSAELASLDRELHELGLQAESSLHRITREIYLKARRWSLTGSTTDARSAREAVEAALRRNGTAPDLILAKTALDLRSHRLGEAAQSLELLPHLRDHPGVITLKSDLAMQHGRYEEARLGYLDAVVKRPTWDLVARLAHLTSLIGDPLEADQLYGQAETELTAKEMRSYAWVELQRGQLSFRGGRLTEARNHYEIAVRAYSGWWLVEERLAELLGAEGRYDEAAALYQQILAKSPLPEVQQALGDLYQFASRSDLAQPWYTRALAAYLESTRKGETQYFHQLAAFYSESRIDGRQAVHWAQKDLELRRNFTTLDALAWALYRAGRLSDAHAAIDAALASHVNDAHLFIHAGMIRVAEGYVDEGQRFFDQARAINPRLESFHAHR